MLLGVTLVTSTAVWRAPGARTLALFRSTMALCVVAGALGLVLHMRGNLEFALERDPRLTGSALLWKALRGATPVLAPGAMAQLGLLGLALAWRRPGSNASQGVE